MTYAVQFPSSTRDKVKALKQMFIDEARKYQVFPLDASVAARMVASRPNITAGRSEFVYKRPMIGLPQGDSPFLLDSSVVEAGVDAVTIGECSAEACPADCGDGDGMVGINDFLELLGAWGPCH